ncbi:calcium-dependent protein kinase 1-like [Rhodamnia argentea]|uniref:Calcium-dependent protein kinase 1-like n=1 Tax=Rhodamnia argentea TaxID=178133 RepID=A0ABM3GTU2_9MYRT|nr:calcium-dependent protein kinase 1-like [Rhodamnia argentea]
MVGLADSSVDGVVCVQRLITGASIYATQGTMEIPPELLEARGVVCLHWKDCDTHSSRNDKNWEKKILFFDQENGLQTRSPLAFKFDWVAPDKPLDSAVSTCLKQFFATNKFKNMVLKADIDNSSTIDYWDSVAASLQLNKVEKEVHLLAAFSYFDRDGSGYITQDELQQACEEFGIEDVRSVEMILYQDRDGRIDYNELMMQKVNTDQRGLQSRSRKWRCRRQWYFSPWLAGEEGDRNKL